MYNIVNSNVNGKMGCTDMSENKKNAFVLYHDIREPLELLTDEERGQLFSAILNYAEYGEVPELGAAAQMAFAFIRTSLDRDAEKWEEKRQKRAEAGRAGGMKRAERYRQEQDSDTQTELEQANEANATFAKQTQQTQANQAVPVPVPVNVPVREKESVCSADKPRTHTRFVPPTMDEVEPFCWEQGNGVDPPRLVDCLAAVRTRERSPDRSTVPRQCA